MVPEVPDTFSVPSIMRSPKEPVLPPSVAPVPPSPRDWVCLEADRPVPDTF